MPEMQPCLHTGMFRCGCGEGVFFCEQCNKMVTESDMRTSYGRSATITEMMLDIHTSVTSIGRIK